VKKSIIFRGEIYSLYCTLARIINTISSLLVLMSGTSADGGAGYGFLRRSEHSHVNNVLQLRTIILLQRCSKNNRVGQNNRNRIVNNPDYSITIILKVLLLYDYLITIILKVL